MGSEWAESNALYRQGHKVTVGTHSVACIAQSTTNGYEPEMYVYNCKVIIRA